MDDFLPPTTFKICIGETHQRLERDMRDHALLPFSSRDSLIPKENIRDRFEAFGHDWDEWWTKVSENVKTFALEEGTFISHKEESIERATDFFDKSIQQLELRIEAEKYVKYVEKFEIELSELVSSKKTVIDALETITPSLDQIGLIFLGSANRD